LLRWPCHSPEFIAGPIVLLPESLAGSLHLRRRFNRFRFKPVSPTGPLIGDTIFSTFRQGNPDLIAELVQEWAGNKNPARIGRGF